MNSNTLTILSDSNAKEYNLSVFTLICLQWEILFLKCYFVNISHISLLSQWKVVYQKYPTRVLASLNQDFAKLNLASGRNRFLLQKPNQQLPIQLPLWRLLLLLLLTYLDWLGRASFVLIYSSSMLSTFILHGSITSCSHRDN